MRTNNKPLTRCPPVSLPNNIHQLRLRNGRGERLHRQTRVRRLLVRERKLDELELAERRAEERQPERHVRPALARRRCVAQGRVRGEEAERDGHDRVARDRGGPGGDVGREKEGVERVCAERAVDAARAAEVVVCGECVEEGLVDLGALGGDKSCGKAC